MIKVQYFDKTGKRGDDISLKFDESVFKFNEKLIAQAALVENSKNLRASGKSKTKGEVSGGGRKPWRQKGTGRARAGSIRSPLFKGGGVTFGPTGLQKKLEMPEKMRKLALKQLYVDRIKKNDLVIIEDIGVDSGKTKDAAQILAKISPDKSSYIVATCDEVAKFRPWNNLVLATPISGLSLRINDLLKSKKFIFSKNAFERVKRIVENEKN